MAEEIKNSKKVKLKILKPMINPEYLKMVEMEDSPDCNVMLANEKNKKSGINRGTLTMIMNNPKYLWEKDQIVEVDSKTAEEILNRKVLGFNKLIGKLEAPNFTPEQMERPVEYYAEIVK